MFAERSTDIALWGLLDAPPPGAKEGHGDQHIEDVLPISSDLRSRLLAWAQAHRAGAGRSGAELDEEGYALSRELATELGERYLIEYGPGWAGRHRQVLRRRADAEPLPGWRLRG